MKITSTILSLFFLSNLIYNSTVGQNSIDALTKGYDAYVIEHKKTDKLTLDNGELMLTSTLSKRNKYIGENFRYYTRGRVYFSDLNKVEIKNVATYHEGKLIDKVNLAEISTRSEMSWHIFYEDSRYYQIHYNGIQKGSETVLEYERKYEEPRLWSGFYFSSYIPTQKASLTIEVDNDINIGWKAFNIPKGALKIDSTMHEGYKRFSFSMVNVPANITEDMAPKRKYYVPHIVPYIKSYKTKEGTKKVFNDYTGLYSWYHSITKEKVQIMNDELGELVTSITAPTNTDMENAKLIFQWVQNNISYVAFEQGWRGFIPFTAPQICEQKYGDCKDMATLLYRMLNHVGIKANLSWVGSSDLPYTYDELPTPSTDNHLITTAIIDGKRIIFDATDNYLEFGLPSSFIQGKQVLVGKEDGSSEIITIPIIEAERNLITHNYDLKIVGSNLVGKANFELKGYSQIDFRHRILNKHEVDREESFRETYRVGNNKFFLKNLKLENLKELNKPVKCSYDFSVNDYVRSYDDERLYVNINLDKEYYIGLLDETRKLPLQFDNTEKVISNIKLEIPAGYVVDQLPKEINYQNEKFSISTKWGEINGTVTLQVTRVVNQLMIYPKDFNDWNKFIAELYQSYQQVLTLKRR